MQTTSFITVIKTVFNHTKPVVVFELANGTTIFRYPKQALIDLQNSGRALSINANALDRGLSALSPFERQDFQTALIECANAQITGDIITYKAGDEYEITAQHPSITDKSHPDFGKTKIGDKKLAEKDGNRVEGFLFIPLTEAEKLRRDMSVNMAKAMMQMYGLGSVPTPITQSQPTIASPVLGNVEDAFEDLPVVDTTADIAGVNKVK
jgi:hypothetical protein